ncbi:MAG: glycosyltransferase, partial [Candidatus Heimdallarchaeota archaeon]|nr:glycosyltransferase [Candidatus Heimdallarchaeota archaeon]
ADYLKKAVQSVLDQTFNNFEIVIINNYSIDNTLEIISAFNDARIKVINFKNDGIIAKSRNQGIMQSVGKYVAFLDDDDLWCPDKLELQIKYMGEHPEFDLVYSNALIIDEHGNKNGLLMTPKQAKIGKVFLNMVYKNFVPILTVLMKKEIFESIGLLTEDTSMRGREDYEYWLRTSLNYKFGYINKSLALYRIHSKGVSMSINRPLMTQKTLQRFMFKKEVPEKYYKNIAYNIERLNSDISVYYWSISDKSNARVFAKKYLIFNLKNIHILNAAAGFLLYVIINFDYYAFEGLVKYISRMRKHTNL